MKTSEWLYYNHAAIPTTAPHETPDLTPISDGSIWSIEGKRPFMARYTTDWDCGYNTEWWYVIKDSPFDISTLKTKRRYEITKALRFFDVKEINPIEYADDLAHVQEQALSAYPAKYRPVFKRNLFIKSVQEWSRQIETGSLKAFGAFYKENNKLAGYSLVNVNSSFLAFSVQKTIPNFEKYNINAALVNGILESFKDELSKGRYICDGTRAINHETHFQDYLEKYFGFRKSYCKLKIVYSHPFKFLVAFLFPFRRLFAFIDRRIGTCHQVYALLRMEEIARGCR